ncbi:PEP/pyruvate-binding domain-containing protein [Anaeromicropila herbilytica]|uniref:Pyruvate phosphate dikinase AMP/ATP-binding domain-containing protein n=1 Tax=Anaeromicropila herbilytica TaxID=2785025 RepID=A0A7R7EKL5_9FIRM|nr:PEP/pyruvate-binding domain-containing protein [Anaeromicropila herbilytica]BCN30850.1 hypothetical protein bsdtb5_21450 [Anaeromicropila herbilytica]
MIKQLEKLSKADIPFYGSKAANLGELLNAGILVPQGFALSFEFFMEYLVYNNIHYLHQDYFAFGPEIKEKILKGSFSPEMEEHLMLYYHKLNKSTKNTTFVFT